MDRRSSRAQTLLERLDERPGRLPGAQEADPVYASGLLCLGAERRGEKHALVPARNLRRSTTGRSCRLSAVAGGLYEKWASRSGSCRSPLQAGWSVAERLRYRLGRGRHYNTSSPVVAAKSAACEHVLETAPLFAATAAILEW